ncbi:hypothetical protein J437_LFUL008307 [Ladona fulva]|uniref:LITAF domain-containing protein n=1 Tax=Ladona fulva TaxID=123851 RepID=A0A8K0K6K0_LADFU|nr:hypothetical protein J437_LFUL008307 [Ladona fulva]
MDDFLHTAATIPLGPQPVTLTCPSCGARITSRINYETSTRTHGMCMAMCAFGLWLCCFLPYLMDSCKNANHYCPNCNAYLGQYQK